jgi:hypothetical protein
MAKGPVRWASRRSHERSSPTSPVWCGARNSARMTSSRRWRCARPRSFSIVIMALYHARLSLRSGAHEREPFRVFDQARERRQAETTAGARIPDQPQLFVWIRAVVAPCGSRARRARCAACGRGLRCAAVVEDLDGHVAPLRLLHGVPRGVDRVAVADRRVGGVVRVAAAVRDPASAQLSRRDAELLRGRADDRLQHDLLVSLRRAARATSSRGGMPGRSRSACALRAAGTTSRSAARSG